MFGGDRGVGVVEPTARVEEEAFTGVLERTGKGEDISSSLPAPPFFGVLLLPLFTTLVFLPSPVVPLLATLLLSPPLSPLTLGLLIPTFDLAAVPALPLYLPATLFLVDFMSSTLGAPPVLADRGVLEAEAEVEGRLEGVFMRTGPERRPDDGRVAAIGVRAGDLATAFLPCSPNLVCTLIFLPPNPPS
eukprot:CAMPEP_0118672166 /NCGR_PEP_ID=MMETSP0785-20121206/22395_1 /TAXON_ID=91992 /ORGANISM="Bolidomonas pacifica, Strain CCMP 1866" /LENGTH=188 /DNA_ID=CAMNT_0006567109 /DNA_START=131 /DNA_END=698 /DNA_ORIENTATION=+